MTTAKSEADWIAAKIEAMVGGVRIFSRDSGISDGIVDSLITGFHYFAILCRTSALFGEIETALNNHGIPYEKASEKSPLQMTPFCDWIKTMRAIRFNLNTGDDIPMDRIKNIWQMFTEQRTVFEIIQYLALVQLKEDPSKYFLAEIKAAILDYGADYDRFLADYAMRSGEDPIALKKEAVSLSTIHAAKGREFRAVFIPACEEEIIPYSWAGVLDEESISEEKRLLYVAITRSRSYLDISFSENRFYRGKNYRHGLTPFLTRVESSGLLYETRGRKKICTQPKLPFFSDI